MSIILNPELEDRISAKVLSGDYLSPDEVVRACLDLLEARDAATQGPRNGADTKARRPISAIIAELALQVPEEELSTLPADLSSNIDHYLYGAPRAESPKMPE